MVACFEDGGFNLDEETYDENKKVLQDLLHGTKVKVLNEDIQLCMDMKDIFHNKPNKTNLQRFFKNKAIQILWFDDTWYRGEVLGNILKTSDSVMRAKLVNLFEKVQPADVSILP